MSCILEIFSALNLAPQVIRKGNRHIILNCESEGLLFLNASNYFKGSYEDISKQFNLNISPIYFPTKLNLPENSEFVGSSPTIEHFYDMMDTEEEKLSKEDFVKSFSNCEWSFKEQLAKASNYKTEILAKACVIRCISEERAKIIIRQLTSSLELTTTKERSASHQVLTTAVRSKRLRTSR